MKAKNQVQRMIQEQARELLLAMDPPQFGPTNYGSASAKLHALYMMVDIYLGGPEKDETDFLSEINRISFSIEDAHRAWRNDDKASWMTALHDARCRLRVAAYNAGFEGI